MIKAETCSIIDTNNKELLCVREYALVNIETSLHKGIGSVKTEHIFPTLMPSCCEGLFGHVSRLFLSSSTELFSY